MALKNIIQKRMLVLIGLVLAAVLIIALVQTSDSVDSAEQAVKDSDEDIVLTPVYELNGRALFFFIRGENSFGAATATETWFGWRMETKSESTIPALDNADRIDSYMSDGDGFIFGLFDAADGRSVHIGGMPTDQLPLDERFPKDLLAQSGLADKAVWFIENVPEDRPLPLQLLDENGQELHLLELY
ncbi:hypothetical protein [Planococcus sp. ISL-109]|uniref:hypothetical protein n=1 Tax=Planococcus sp. ISL-109 TaxID=2819166 RepID=UPI001BE86D55|nr:hypothetical protein [Planococcus sp. ISL-109]MBT2584235.1 hypothetical protein [Planococcus sp. ISL-109]